ncbi:hypothetical protein CAI21_20950 [Alkalilimnicola ehrlichii]|uniref:TonB-dependent receptor n=1 Tax=Alkalilimnicola ehrlichii TaxID=351052 RepID=A0A3E0WH07_9GAMM|nr:TonB-dependent receptor [Alkalilimnicola ehrlichii]RFA24624.1 hypothetical protein CAI21_20950 [Alkalilimnicola ehrlichii]RFA31729.1 hypothetical protein CAL65_21600 [Alkalilimnicola ehrlichii]
MMNAYTRRASSALALAACALPLVSHAETATRLETLRIEERFMPFAPATKAEEALRRIPGGTTVVDEKQLREGRSANLEDALKNAPGVYAKSRYGQDEIRLSIRGSGLSRNFNTRGIRLLRDGLPVTEADGNTRTQLIDPLTASHIEVYRGANALGMGAATLGGAINLVSPTAHNSPALRLRGETGRFDYRRLQGTAAWLGEGGHDALASFTYSHQDGFREQSEQTALRFYGNVGLSHGQHAETRIHLEAQSSELQLPGSLTYRQYRDNPRQAVARNVEIDAARDLRLLRLSAQQQRRLRSGNSLQLGAFVQDLQMDHPVSHAEVEGDQQDAGLSFRHTLSGDWRGRENRFTWGGLAVAGIDTTERVPRGSGEALNRDYTAATTELYALNELALGQNTELVVGTQWLWALREVEVTAGTGPDAREYYQDFSPRIGLIRQLHPQLQLFGNISRSVEPPITGELMGLDDETLDAQRADTLELGLRGTGQQLRWEAVAYHARLRDEILIFQHPDLPDESAAGNAERTFHQGLEVGLALELPLTERHNLDLFGSWTYNRFKFDDDAQWGDNRLPGVPKQRARLEVRYRHANGFYVGPSLEAVSGYPVDFANSTEVSGYALWGASAGYQIDRHLRVFLDARNLTNRQHVASTGVVAVAEESRGLYNPGAPRAVYGGVEWQW